MTSGMASRPLATVVICTRNRPALLRDCLAALASQASNVEIVIVDDGSTPPLRLTDLESDAAGTEIRLIHGEGRGPARARNRGIKEANSDVVLFTDDDVVPSENWVAAALAHLDENPEHLGVDGPVGSPPWDPLFEHSLTADGPHRWTCNVAYRTDVLRAVGGFRETVFPRSNEDTDLAARVEERGPIGFAPAMRVMHTPRTIGLRDVIRLTRTNEASMLLHALHPRLGERYRLPTRIVFVWWAARRFPRFWSQRPPGARPSSRRIGRLVTATVAATGAAVYSAIRTPPYAVMRRRHGGPK